MDHYTQKTEQWLDDRFKQAAEKGVYRAHQPIYGFRKGFSDGGEMGRYTITYQIMKALGCLQFESLVDVGGAEGYKAALARKLFGVEVISCDLSQEACNRAKEIYNLPAQRVDIQKLPFKDGQFDVVVCSEVLEHVPQLQSATRELLRVAAKAVVITVPHEPAEVIKRNIEQNIPHAHIHSLTENSFDFVANDVCKIMRRRIMSHRGRLLRKLVNAEPETGSRYPKFVASAYNLARPWCQHLFGVRTAGLVVRIDEWACDRLSDGYDNILITLVKNERCILSNPRIKVRPRDIIEFTVPYHYLKF